MIKHLMTVAFAFLAIGNAVAQRLEHFEHAQARIQEGVHEFFVRPEVAELKLLDSKGTLLTNETNPQCIEITKTVYEGMVFETITNDMLENAKANAAYLAAKDCHADIILGATFYVDYKRNEGGLKVTVRGYPAKYVNFHTYNGEQDNKWFDALMKGQNNRQSSTQAVRTNNK